jgi:hypothetical protein
MPGRSSLASALKTRSPKCSEGASLRDTSEGQNLAPELFHSPHVTSDLALKIKLRDDGRGRDARVNPQRRASKSFIV